MENTMALYIHIYYVSMCVYSNGKVFALSCFSLRHWVRISKAHVKLMCSSRLLHRDGHSASLMGSVHNRPGRILWLCPKLIGRTEQKNASKHPLLLQNLPSPISKECKSCYWTPKASQYSLQQNKKQKKMPENPSTYKEREQLMRNPFMFECICTHACWVLRLLWGITHNEPPGFVTQQTGVHKSVSLQASESWKPGNVLTGWMWKRWEPGGFHVIFPSFGGPCVPALASQFQLLSPFLTGRQFIRWNQYVGNQ